MTHSSPPVTSEQIAGLEAELKAVKSELTTVKAEWEATKQMSDFDRFVDDIENRPPNEEESDA